MTQDSIIIDLDDTITIDNSSDNYNNKKLNDLVHKAIINARMSGLKIKIFSARNMRTYEGDLEKIEKYTRPLAENWLATNNVEYDEFRLGKPWAGKNGFYVDDKNMHIDEFIFKFCGPFYNKKISVVTSLFNEQENIKKMHQHNKKAERLLEITEYIYINNGSTDSTLKILNEIKKYDEKIKVITNKENLGYGGGMKEGIYNSSGEIIITNHADMQFDLYQFIMTNYEKIMEYNELHAILPIRLNRKFLESLNSSILRLIISVFSLKKISDFNGQPKFLNRRFLPSSEKLPNDFCLDLALYNLIVNEAIALPIIQNDRNAGSSSWSGSLIKRLQIFIRYISYSINRK